MIDLHMHSLHSDGELIPAELVRRAQVAGYQAMAITDHADQSNLETLIPRLVETAQALTRARQILVLGGVEFTHVPPEQIAGLIQYARELGAELVVVHGETPVEPVAPGTNLAAIMGNADVLAHPGLIPLKLAKLARQRGVALEITSRGGHSLTNGHVASVAMQAGCDLVVNSDTHSPGNLHSPELIRRVVLGAGLPASAIRRLQANAWKIGRRVRKEFKPFR